MKKIKILALFLALATCLSLVSCKRREGEESRGLEMTLAENGAYYIVTGIGKCKDYDVLLPAEHKGLPVAAVGERAFKGTEITRITLTENVLFIAENAFENCASLTYNELNGIYYIGTEKNPAYALVSVSKNSDTTFVLHEKTKIIADCAFYDCDMDFQELPEGVTHIGKNAFYSCGEMQSITLPETVCYIGEEAFGNCNTLAKITLPKALAYIGSSAFMYCSKLKEINFAGTEAEWNAIEKSSEWDRDMKEYAISFAK
jgi:hypothetical protein